MIPWIATSRNLNEAVNEISDGKVQVNRHFGIGFLVEATSAIVTETTDRSYTLELDYPTSGAMYSSLSLGTIIVAVPNQIDGAQPFRITQMRSNTNGSVHIIAPHAILTDIGPGMILGTYQCLPGAKNAISDMDYWLDSHGITVAIDGTFDSKVGLTIKNRALADIFGDIVDTYGGELHYTGSTVTLMQKRGTNRNLYITYGVNMLAGEFTMSNSSEYGKIRPYYKVSDTNIVYGNDLWTQHGSDLKLPSRNFVERVDVSSYLSVEQGATPSQSDVTNAGKLFVQTHPGAGMASISCKVSFVPSILGETIGLYDTAVVQHSELGISISSMVTKTVWNVLLERYNNVEIGTPPVTISQAVNGIQVKKPVEYIDVTPKN